MTGDAVVHQLLAWCARPRMPGDLMPELSRRAARIEDWAAAFSEAERHGLGPLLRQHLRDARVALPIEVERLAAAIFIRHRRENALRLRVLAEILEVLEARGIDARVLKGPALMSLVYGDPALRPTSDLDLLVPVAAALGAQQILQDMGFSGAHRASEASLVHHHHLPAATRSVEGVLVQVELHHDALAKDHGMSIALDARQEPPLAIDVGGRPALALGPHEMLRHLCLHLVGPLPRPLRLIWIADVLGFVEGHVARLDWAALARRDPLVLNVLALAGGLTPLPEVVARHVPASVVARMCDIAGSPAAWSWVPPRQEPGGHRMRLGRALNPPAWWLVLKYSRAGRSMGWQLRLRHLRALARVATRRAPTRFEETGPR